MSPPRNPPVPRFAPENSITLAHALETFGRAVDPAWTGEEINSETSINDREHQIFMTVMRETREAQRRGQPADLSHEGLLSALQQRREMELATRHRWQATAIRFMRYLHQGMLIPFAMGNNDGTIYTMPAHLWAAERAEDLFDNGGCLEVRDGDLAIPRGPMPVGDIATVLVNDSDLQRLVRSINAGETEVQQVDPDHTGYQGRPTLKPAIEREFRRRAEANEYETTIKAQGEALHLWVAEAYPGKAIPTARVIENQIRPLYNRVVGRTK